MHHLAFATASDLTPPGSEYNYASMPATVLPGDVARTFSAGPAPGDPAPDFTLPTTDGERVSLGALRGRPVLLIFGSVT